jgi:antagonist of KipI
MDWYSHRLANRLLGHDASMATLEVTLTGPHIRFEASAAFAVAGAAFHMTLDDVPVEMNRAVEAGPGAILKFGERLRGARAYIALSGGVDVPEVLGSRSTHALTGMGGLHGRALKTGDTLETGSGAILPFVENYTRPLFLQSGGARLRMIPDDDRLTAHITSQRFRVSPRSDRMGYRLEGAEIDTPPEEIISTAVPTGAIQVPPGGQPIVQMRDAQGGMPLLRRRRDPGGVREEAQVVTSTKAGHDDLLFGFGGGGFFQDLRDFVQTLASGHEMAADSAVIRKLAFVGSLHGRNRTILNQSDLD